MQSLTRVTYRAFSSGSVEDIISRALSQRSAAVSPNRGEAARRTRARNAGVPYKYNYENEQALGKDKPVERKAGRRGIEQLWEGGFLDSNNSFEDKKQNSKTGDAWPACLLRLKSFDDLHKLWYVCLKEKNLLLGEQWSAWQEGIKMQNHGRLKKVKMTMKRILTVITQREIHQQGIRAKALLEAQEARDVLEQDRCRLEEDINDLTRQIGSLGAIDSISRASWASNLQRMEADLSHTLNKLKPLRLETMELLTPDWKYQRKYSDLPGPVSWTKQYVPALKNKYTKPTKTY